MAGSNDINKGVTVFIACQIWGTHHSSYSSDWQALRDKGIRINSNTTLFESDATTFKNAFNNIPESSDMLVVSDATAHFPEWIKRSVCSDESAQRYQKLVQRFEAIQHNLPADSLVSLAVRCLLIHEWRRLLLRSNPVPPELVPEGWPHSTCHQFVAGLYQQLFDTGEQWMNENAIGPNGPLKITDPACKNRFSNDLY